MHRHLLTYLHGSLALLIFGLAAATAATAAVDPPPSNPVYTGLRLAVPDGRVVQVKGLVLERDVYRFQLDGTFHLLSPVEGRTVGAVFIGQGSYRLSPATPRERRHLALVTGADKGFETLSDSFEEMVVLFADDTAAEIGLAAPIEQRAPDPRAAEIYKRWSRREREDFHVNFQLRLLEDLLNSPGLTSGVFMALIGGKKYSPVLAAVDPNGAEGLLPFARMGEEDTLLLLADSKKGGVWYLSDRRAEVDAHRRSPAKILAHPLDYQVETRVQHDTGVAGQTIIRFQVESPGLRVLPLHLLAKLRLTEAAFAPAAAAGEPSWRPAALIQEEQGEAAAVFPEPLARKSILLLRLSYAGDAVLTDAGDKNFVVGARESWYPNLGVFSEPARFELTYRVPAGNEIVSVGRRVEARSERGLSVSVWKTDTPIEVAGFNYGKFKKIEKHDEPSGIDVAVYTNPGTPDILREIDEYTRESSSSIGRVNTARLAESALADGINSARLYTTYYGPLPDPHVAITQQSQWGFGQSWPSLIFLPYLAFLDGTQRQRLGLTFANDFVNQVGFHEFAHQWWGHLVTAECYRDVWLEEGFAEFSAALGVQHTQGWAAYDKIWRDARTLLFAKLPGSAVANAEAGPIDLGFRLATSRTPAAYQALVYYKGAYVLHMLRMLMWDGGSPAPDGRFIAMMKDFAAAYAGKRASTADFQRVVERHMVPALNATGNGKMDWFFKQWVYGTEAPLYRADLRLESAGDQVRIKGKVSQEGVSPDFRALLPIYLELDKGATVRVALLPLVGTATVSVDTLVKPPGKPRRVLINARSEVLARD
ncbi:MAG: hypothetical protein M3O15_04360 [Acidobacteriota bacterium]|nr:hypothetical protein [Acidobacteriota bacterium]